MHLLHESLGHWAAATPKRTALVDGERSFSYAELHRLTNRIANLLRSIGVGKGDRVGLYAKKSAEGVAGAYGIMKAGAVYVPLDPDAPVERLAYIASNCDISVLIVGEERLADTRALTASAPGVATVVVLDGHGPETNDSHLRYLSVEDVESATEDDPPVRVIDHDLALMLYTSGSTGAPKGVMLSHLNVMTFVRWAVDEFSVSPDDHLSQIAPMHFDLSTFDIYGAALAGASVHLAPRTASMFPIEMRRFLEQHEISVMYAVPSALIMLTERSGLEAGDLPSLATVLFAGEVFPTKYLSRLMRLLPHVGFANLYGPTETNVCTFFRVGAVPDEDDPPVSIGHAIDNVETFVVRDDGSIAPPGEVGELHVRGATVMQGYWGDAERTERSRIANRFTEGLSDPVYKTGDLVIEEADGDYTFLGRRDNQIKSRGYRIELGDIEAAIYLHPSVTECAAVAVPDDRITNRIMAYVSVDEKMGARELISFLSDHLPKYMLPDEIEISPSLPKTSTGKIDRQALLEPAQHEETK